MGLPTVLARVGLPVLVDALGGALSRIDNPVARTAAKTLSHTHEALVNGGITPEQTAEANRHLERIAELENIALSEVNQSLRAEIASQDGYVRRMRPTFGYLMAVTWAIQMLSLAYVIAFKTDEAAIVVDAVESLSAIWTVALSVLGIYVYKRSEEKRSVVRHVIEAAQAEKPPAPARPREPYNR